MEGPCEKKTDKYFSWWNQRYLFLDRHKLRYFADKKDKAYVKLQKGFFDLRNIESLYRDEEIDGNVILHLTFRTERKKRTVLLKFNTSDYDGWLSIFSSYYEYVITPPGPYGRLIPIPINFAEGMWSCLERLEKIGALEIEGIFRKAGAELSCNKLEHDLLFDGVITAEWASYDPHDISQVFSRLLGKLPDGILVTSLWTEWTHASSVKDIQHCLKVIPPLNRFILQKLFSIFKKITSNPETKMNIKAITIIFTILMQPHDLATQPFLLLPELDSMFQILINQYDECFPDGRVAKFTTKPAPIFSQLALVPRFNRYRDVSVDSPRNEHYRRRSTGLMIKTKKPHTKSHDELSMKSAALPRQHPHFKDAASSPQVLTNEVTSCCAPFSKGKNATQSDRGNKLTRKARTLYVQRNRESHASAAMSHVSSESSPARITPAATDDTHEKGSQEHGYRHASEKQSYIQYDGVQARGSAQMDDYDIGPDDYYDGIVTHKQYEESKDNDYSDFDEDGITTKTSSHAFGGSSSGNVSQDSFSKTMSGKNINRKTARPKHDHIDERDLHDLMNLEEEILNVRLSSMSPLELRKFLKVAIYQIGIQEDREESFVYNIKDLQQQIERLSHQNQVLQKSQRSWGEQPPRQDDKIPSTSHPLQQRQDLETYSGSIRRSVESAFQNISPDLADLKTKFANLNEEFRAMQNDIEEHFRAFTSQMNTDHNRISGLLRRSSSTTPQSRSRSGANTSLSSHIRSMRHDSTAVLGKVCDVSNRISRIIDSADRNIGGVGGDNQASGKDFRLSL